MHWYDRCPWVMIGLVSNTLLGLATIANMGAEVGATTSTFPYTSNMRSYLRATGRSAVAAAADEAASKGFLQADEKAEYDEVIEIVSRFLLRLSLVTDSEPPRICQSSNRLSMAPSLQTWLHLCRSLVTLSRSRDGMMIYRRA
jgi:hypothetical protein